MLELYVDDDRRGSKTQRNDSLHQAGTVDVSLNGFTNGNRIVVKILASASDKLDPSLKIELKPDKEDSLLTYTLERRNTDASQLRIFSTENVLLRPKSHRADVLYC